MDDDQIHESFPAPASGGIEDHTPVSIPAIGAIANEIATTRTNKMLNYRADRGIWAERSKNLQSNRTAP